MTEKLKKSGEASSSAQKLSQEIGNLSSEMSKTQGEIKETSSELADYKRFWQVWIKHRRIA